ncbi:hypothetical protein D3C87_262180 [compost metagenome]
MKNLKMITLVMTMLCLGINKLSAQESTAQTVIIRTFELFGGGGNQSQMIVTSPDGTTKTTGLKNIETKNYSIGVGNNNTVLQSEINHWKNQGFILDDVSNTVAGALMTTIFVFTKEK